MSEKYTEIAVYVVIGIVLGVAVGYFAAGPLTYDNRVRLLSQQLDEQIEAMQDYNDLRGELYAAQGQVQVLQEEVEDLEAEIEELMIVPPLTGSLDLVGSTAIYPIALEVGNQFEDLHSQVNIRFEGGGSDFGVIKTASGEADIGLVSRPFKDSEINANPQLVSYAIAKDGIAVIINIDNPLAGDLDLTIEQLQMVFNGNITNWKDLGGSDQEIDIFIREPRSGTRYVFEELVMGDKSNAPSSVVKASSDDIKEAIISNQFSIGYVSMAFVDETVSLVLIDGKEPNANTVTSGTYPLVRILYMIVRGIPSELEIEFLSFVTGTRGQQTIADLGYAPIN